MTTIIITGVLLYKTSKKMRKNKNVSTRYEFSGNDLNNDVSVFKIHAPLFIGSLLAPGKIMLVTRFMVIVI